MPVIADTSFLVDVSRKKAAALRAAEALDDERATLLIPTVALAEFLAGSVVDEEFLPSLRSAAEIIDFTTADAKAAGAVARECFKRGSFPGWTDCFILGMARQRGGLTILTANPRHFAGADVRSY